jgi:hypothetical protein
MSILHELGKSRDRATIMQDSPHDKRVRKQRRQDMVVEDRAFSDSVSASEDIFIDRCIKILLPEGSNSLILPTGAGLFLGKIDEMLAGLQVVAKSLFQKVFSKERKVDILCRGYVYIYLWGCKGCPIDSSLESEVPTTQIEKIAQCLEKPLGILFPTFSSYTRYIPKEMIARRIVEFVYAQMGRFSLEKSMLLVLERVLDRKNVEYVLRTSEELDTVIATLCADEKIPSALLRKFMIASPEAEEPDAAKKTVLETFLQGLKASMAEKASKNILQSIPWRETFFHLLEEVRFFVLSSYCNKAFVEGLNKAIDR